jgi:F0F1-type ATP synthase membrane subunit b/b'
MRAEFEREVEAARREFAQEAEAVRRELGKKIEAIRTRALDEMGHTASLKRADMRTVHSLLRELEQHLLK